MFADSVDFTTWSSVREPKQVFTLLETLYGAFNTIADRRGVFKVETIGDSYVAVVGLPEPRKEHAVVTARFARDCRNDMSRLTRELEITLGPDTDDLQLRFGLHSGPVTAGVLRGQKSRFNFLETVNTAARMESNGIRNRIQVSQTTADLLIAAGKEHWVTKSDELVTAKGAGKMQTY
jgi:class 3 adenylate cyclase